MLTSVRNPLVKQIKLLHRAKGRRESGQFLLEGTHLIQEAGAVDYPLDVLCCTAAWRDRYPSVFAIAAERAERVEEVTPEVLAAMATTVTPDGAIAAAPREYRDRVMDPSQPFRCGILLETVQDPGNLGTIVRAAAAAGADRLWTSADCVDLDHPKVLRATAGQWFRLPCGVCADPIAAVAQAQGAGVTVVAATVDPGAASYWDVPLAGPVLLVLGNEGAGRSAELAAAADVQVRIPLAPGVESLNVAIASALLLYEVARQGSQPLAPG